MLPQPGHVVLLSRDASPQFVRAYPFRVIRAQPWSTYRGWVWLHGYELDGDGQAVGKEARDVFVRVAGLKRLPDPQPKPRTPRPTPPRKRTQPGQRVQPTWHLAKEA